MKIILVGCGSMGGALLEAWLSSHIVAPSDMHVIAPRGSLKNLGDYTKKVAFHQHTEDDIAALSAESADFIVLAVRPQIMADILPRYQRFAEKNTAFFTVAAGLTDSFYRGILGEKTQIIRIMPNMPTAIGKGMNAVYYNEHVTLESKKRVDKLLNVLGEVEILSDEDDMDAFTVLAGSGPAYLYLLVESMTQAAVKLGFDNMRAEKIALETVLGSAEYMKETGSQAQALREKIALPGGVTEAALHTLMADDRIFTLFQEALKAGWQRSKSMASEMSGTS